MDIQSLRETEEQLPEIVHLLAAPGKDQFLRGVAGKEGLFIFVPPDEMDTLREDYRVDNRSNHYFLIGEDGKVLANHYDLNTANKLRGTWGKVADRAPETAWTPAQWLRFWQSLGIGALGLLFISGVVLWRRRIATQRDLRRRQLLETELRGIRSQMNPYFLFNAMSSIQNLIRKDEQEKADQYLGQFAGLMRKTLRNTSEEYIPLTDEIETLEHYCSLESLPKIDFEIIFVTAYDQYAIRAIKFTAVDYLLKPIDALELKKAVERVQSKRRQQSQRGQLKALLHNLQQQEKKIALPQSDHIEFVAVNTIIRCQGDRNYTHFFLKDGRELLVSRTLKEYVDLLDDQSFYRVHQSHLVNLHCIQQYRKRDGGMLITTDGAKIPVARARKDGLLERLLERD